jgi:thioredoxin 1
MIKVEDDQGLTSQLEANKNHDIIVLFYSTWCPFCRSFQPVFDKYAEKADSAVYVKVPLDEDENPMWETYSIDAVPTILLFRDGQVSKRLDCERGVGLNEAKFSAWLKNI